MNTKDEQRQAAEALAIVRTHQHRARRAARLPWWVYPAIFVLTAGLTAVNDFVDIGGAKLLAAGILVVLLVVLVATFAGRTALLSRLRGVQQRQTFEPRAFGAVAVAGAVGAWLIFRYGNGFVHRLADAAGLHGYPNTVLGVLYGAAFTLLFALGRMLVAAAERRAGR